MLAYIITMYFKKLISKALGLLRGLKRFLLTAGCTNYETVDSN